MNYPTWQLGFPGGLMIALVAVVHVFVSHFAIGGGAYLVLTERKAYREHDDALLAYVRRHSKFFALLTVVFGAITGVGIWFTIGLVSPEATSSLIHTFVWAWAIEWVFFFVEITAALIYAYNWDKLDRATHLAIGWIYFVAAWLSLVAINGIITYMLTPGRWLATKGFWDGFLNPTYLPSLAIRTLFTVALAGVFGLVTAGKLVSPIREKVVRWAGWWLVGGLALMPPVAVWYFGKFPDFGRQYLNGLIPAAQHTARLGMTCAALAVLLTLLFAVAKPKWMNRAVVTVLVVLCFAVLASGEYLREFSRKPWAINGYIYANDLRLATVEAAPKSGGLSANAKWLAVAPAPTAEYGQQVFVTQCGVCHSVDGYRAIRPKVRGWDESFATHIVPSIDMLRGTMPPFAGNETDAAALGKYLASLNPTLLTITPVNEMEMGHEVYKIRCAVCHSIGGSVRPLAIAGMDAEAIEGLTQALDGIDSHMPPFSGSEAERKALAKWLSAQKQ
jgi:mono/diheme cytochrome c family protein